MSRIENTGKNFFFSVVSTLLSSILSFITRTVFIREIGLTYLGANGLFTNILSMLSLAELGISSAIAFSLYKPLAERDIDTIKSLMAFYKKAYRVVASVIATIGLAILPFLDYLIKDPGDMEHIPVIYLVFLYNSVISYLFSYKVTLLSADQKSYLMTNVNMVINILTAIIQLIVLVVTKNYFAYLFMGAIIGTFQWIFVNKYINGKYPFLKEKNVQSLDDNIKENLNKNIKAMVLHKLGELCINQTDNIIISSFISIVTVALYNNYYMIINIINKFTSSIFGAATASLGNLIATEPFERRYEVFKRYNFLGFWVYGWTAICLYVLLNPFVEIWLGKEYLVDIWTLRLVMINYYLVGMRTTLGNVKIAAGLYVQDQWVPLVQAVINLSVSIGGAVYWGLPGVFLGTVVSSLVPCLYRPIIVYKFTFQRNVRDYFKEYIRYLLIVVCSLGSVEFAIHLLDMIQMNVYCLFICKMCVCVCIPNIIIIILFYKTDEFQYIVNIVKSFIRVGKRV